MKATLALLCSLFMHSAQAQDAATFNYAGLNGKGDTAWDAKLNTPPIHLSESSMLINALSTRHLGIDAGGTHFQLSDYIYSLMSITKWDDQWTMIVRGQAALRNATEQVSWNQKAIFFSGMILFTRPMGESKNWKYSFGLVIPESSVRIPVIPALGFAYDSARKDYSIQITFPLASFQYFPSPDWKIGLGMGFENNAYLLQEGSSLRTGNRLYLWQSRIILAPSARYQLMKHLAIQGRVGFTLKNKTALEDQSHRELQVLDRDPGFFFQGGIAITI